MAVMKMTVIFSDNSKCLILPEVSVILKLKISFYVLALDKMDVKICYQIVVLKFTSDHNSKLIILEIVCTASNLCFAKILLIFLS